MPTSVSKNDWAGVYAKTLKDSKSRTDWDGPLFSAKCQATYEVVEDFVRFTYYSDSHDNAGNLIYLGMVGHKTVLESIRATIQARQRRKLFLHGRPVYPLAIRYSQTWQHLPDYGAYHATLLADPVLPGKWQHGEDVAYILVFE